MRGLRTVHGHRYEPVSFGAIKDADHARNFLDCVRSRQRCHCDIETGHRSTTAALVANIAHKTRSYLQWNGQAERVWSTAETGQQLFANLRALPGFGEQKARIFTALLAKRLGVTPPGWEDVAGPYGQMGHFSVADVDGPEGLAAVREHKKAMKAAAKAGK